MRKRKIRGKKTSIPVQYHMRLTLQYFRANVREAIIRVGYAADDCIVHHGTRPTYYLLSFRYDDLDDLLGLFGAVVEFLPPRHEKIIPI